MSVAVVVLAILSSIVSVSTQGVPAPSSQSLAERLVKRLGAKEPRALSAPVPGDESRFVAVLHMPGSQLLAVSATYPAPALLRELIVKNDHRQVYLDLNSAGDMDGRFFVFDLGQPGLAAGRRDSEPFDITWRNGLTRTDYDGQWQSQKLSEEEYRARFEQDETEYAELLRVLLATESAPATPRQ